MGLGSKGRAALPALAMAAALALAGCAGQPELAEPNLPAVTWCYEDSATPPYLLGEGESIPALRPGVAVELVRQASSRLGLKARLIRTTWAGCIERLKEGKVDGVFMCAFRDERLALGAFPMAGGKADASRRMDNLGYALYAPVGSPVGFDGRAITGLKGRIAAPAGAGIVKELQDRGYDVAEAPDAAGVLALVKAGKAAAGSLQPAVGDALLAAGGEAVAGLSRIEPPLLLQPYFLMLSRQFAKAHPALAEKIWAAVAAVRDSDLAKLHARYAQPQALDVLPPG